MHLNNPKTLPLSTCLWKNCLPQNLSLVPKRLGPLVWMMRGLVLKPHLCSAVLSANRKQQEQQHCKRPLSHQLDKRNMCSKTDFLLSYPLMPWSTPANHHISSPLRASHSQAHTGEMSLQPVLTAKALSAPSCPFWDPRPEGAGSLPVPLLILDSPFNAPRSST